MVVMLNRTWIDQKQAADAASGQGKRSLNSRSQTERTERVSPQMTQSKTQPQSGSQAQGASAGAAAGTGTTTTPGIASQSQTPKGPLTSNRANFPSGSRAETPMLKNPSPNPQTG